MKFRLLEKHTDLGKVADPKIPVQIETLHGFEPFLFLVDTGADFTMLPASFSQLIGLPLSACSKTTMYGIEGKGIVAHVAKITLRLGEIVFQVTALFSENDKTPLILGREGLFDRFNLHFDNRHKRVIFTAL